MLLHAGTEGSRGTVSRRRGIAPTDRILPLERGMPRKTNPRQGRAIKDAKRGNCRFPPRGIETIELGPIVLTVTCAEPLPLASRVSAVGETAHVGPVGDTVQVIEVNA